jgi:putative ABC transport system permease protein
MKDYFILAFKNLRKRGIRSWLTLLGIFIGITAVVSLISLGNGLKAAVNAQFGISETELISVQAGGISGFGPPGSGTINPLTKEDVDAINKLDSVDIAIGRSIETLKVEFNKKIAFIFSVSVPDGEERKRLYEFIDLELESGRLLEDGDDNRIVIGSDLKEGDKNGLGKDLKIGDSLELQDREFIVTGILEKKGSFTIDGAILINDKPLDEIKNLEDTVDIIAVKAKDKSVIEKAKLDIEKLLRESRDVKAGEEDFEVSTPEAALASVNQVLSGIQIFIVIIAAISIFVGAIGISNTMITSVLERKRDIGIMKAIGARNEDIFWQFFIEAGLLGLIGGIIGVLGGLALGYAGTSAIGNFLGISIGIELNYLLIILSLAGSFFVGSASGIWPAMKAARQNPVEALRP